LRKVVGHELDIQQRKTTCDQPCHKMHQRNLAGIAGTAEHAFPEERPAQRNAVQAADEDLVFPDFYAVGEAGAVQLQA